MIAAYREGFAANGKPALAGAMLAKIEWAKKGSSNFPAPPRCRGFSKRWSS